MLCSEAVSWNSCSRFKHRATHSAISGPEFNPIGLRAVGDDLFDSRLGTHHFNPAVSSASA